ncbi:hypothetical protein SAMN04488603_108199 [Paenibacillus sp. cl130]|nr:hypothetical protein SAMN04488603_108199 [Paenibacillus sp. cl130]
MTERAQDNLLRAIYMMHKDNQRFSSSVRGCFFLLFRKHHKYFKKSIAYRFTRYYDNNNRFIFFCFSQWYKV